MTNKQSIQDLLNLPVAGRDPGTFRSIILVPTTKKARDNGDYSITAVIGADETEAGVVILGLADEVVLPALLHPKPIGDESVLGLDTLRLPGAVRVYSVYHDLTVLSPHMSIIRITGVAR